MDLSLIFNIPGKPGLYKLINQGKNNAVVESLMDGKKLPIFNLNQVSSLADIAIYTTDREIELTKVFRAIYQKEDGKETVSHKAPTKEITALFEAVLPNYDRERVYESNIRKLIQWYNILINKSLIDMELSPREKAQEEQEQKAE